MSTYLQNYGCTTAAGEGVAPLMSALLEGRPQVENGVARIPHHKDTSLEECTTWLLTAWEEARRMAPISSHSGSEKIGVVLASTKGIIEDYRREMPLGGWDTLPDSLNPLLQNFLKETKLTPTRSLVVSNACASSHGALYLAKHWIESKRCDFVWVGAVDYLGEFVEKGFRTLQAICQNRCTPFSATRDGLALGEGAAILGLSARPSEIELESVALVTEGISLTRPSETGKGLMAACREVKGESAELICAHGTGTIRNDIAEDSVFSRLTPNAKVTGSKWCVGHTLGVSGAIDTIAVAECLKTEQIYTLGTTDIIDPSLKAGYLKRGAPTPAKLSRALVSSLGFGGTNAAAMLRRTR